jgi:hypothetical protein
MDCEKFDQHVIDELYEELDELTHAALKRHVEGCSRCAAILSGLRATRDVGILPIEEPSDDLEARILDAAFVAQKKAPWPRKVLRGLAWAGSHAMRPQLAMAALFFLVIGSSLLLLRAKPGANGFAPVRVTERGAPAVEAEPLPAATALANAATSNPMIAAAPSPAADSQQATDSVVPAREKAAEVARLADKDAAKLALTDARTVRDSAGCASAVSKYDEVGARFPGTGAAADAMWEAASCYRSMGDATKARELYLALESVGSYRQRAEQELTAEGGSGALNNAGNQIAQRSGAGAGKMPAAAAPAPPAAPPPAVAAAAKPAAAEPSLAESKAATKPTSGTSGSGRNAVSAPKKAPVQYDNAL